MKYDKLSIILIENTEEVLSQKKTIQKIINTLVTEGYVCVINYSNSVKEVQMVNADKMDTKELLYNQKTSKNACLYDALIEAEKVCEAFNKVVKLKSSTDIEIIGIGKCTDNCSKTSKDEASKCFQKLVNNYKALTKYFCLTEDDFISAATIGFRSIGSMCRSYK